MIGRRGYLKGGLGYPLVKEVCFLTLSVSDRFRVIFGDQELEARTTLPYSPTKRCVSETNINRDCILKPCNLPMSAKVAREKG